MDRDERAPAQPETHEQTRQEIARRRLLIKGAAATGVTLGAFVAPRIKQLNLGVDRAAAASKIPLKD